jgi:glycosyltransferase involved in cell wall biosynthesis
MRVLNVNKFYRLVGGSERYYFDLANLLTSRGHQVIPFSMLYSHNRETPYNKYFVSYLDYNQISLRNILRLGPKIVGKMVYSLESKRQIEKLIKDTKPDIAHIHMIDHQISPSILDSLKKLGIPMVQTLHEYKLICPNYRLYIERKKEICERCKGGRYYNTVVHRCLKDSMLGSFLASFAMYVHKMLKVYEKNIDTFIVPSRFARDKMLEFGVDPKKLVFLPYMVDTESFSPNYSHSNYFLYFGRLSKEKGLFTLLHAMKNFRNSLLYVVGSGELEDELRAFLEQNGMDNVKLMGYKTSEELRSLIREARFVVVPSEWYETFGLTIVESFACGKPVIGADIGGITELINPETGLLFQPGNSEDLTEKIEYFLSHPSLLKEMGLKARQFVHTNLSPTKHYEKIMSLYRKLTTKV